MDDFTQLSDHDLLARLAQLVGSQRQLTARLVGCLGEIEERRLHLKAAFSSMYELCTDKLGMGGGEAYRRINAARLARQYPIIYELIESGALNLSARELLHGYLTAENHSELLRDASFKKKVELQELLARRFPKPDAPSAIRKIPEQGALSCEPAESRAAKLEARARASDARLEPLSPERYKVEFTASQELKDKLERAKDLMSHANPTLDLAVVVERALDLLLDKLEKTKLGKASRPRVAKPVREGAISRATRRAVMERDGQQCAYVDTDTGRRCQSRAFLELDHKQPRGLGGSSDADNLQPMCRRHNGYRAEQTYGREHVEERIHFRQQKSKVTTTPESNEVQRKVLKALTHMGFRASEARAALEQADGSKAELSSAADLLRCALIVLGEKFVRTGC